MVWSRENDAPDRMDAVVQEYRRTIEQENELLKAKVEHTARLLEDAAERLNGLTPDECTMLAGALKAP